MNRQVYLNNPLGVIAVTKKGYLYFENINIAFMPEHNRVRLSFDSEHAKLPESFNDIYGFIIYNPYKIIDHLDVFTSLVIKHIFAEVRSVGESIEGYVVYFECAVTSEDFSLEYIHELQKLMISSSKQQTVPSITNVIYEPPATVVYWSDGSKTIVKASDETNFDREIGLAMAISKRYFNNKRSEFLNKAYGYSIRKSKKERRKEKNARRANWINKTYEEMIKEIFVNKKDNTE